LFSLDHLHAAVSPRDVVALFGRVVSGAVHDEDQLAAERQKSRQGGVQLFDHAFDMVCLIEHRQND